VLLLLVLLNYAIANYIDYISTDRNQLGTILKKGVVSFEVQYYHLRGETER
jgi:hypothetical protein